MQEVTVPRTENNQSAIDTPKGRSFWLLLILGLILLSAVVRAIPATQNGGLAAWLPWMNQPLVTLYFADADGRYFVPVSRPVALAADLPRVVLDELIRGPRADSGLRSLLPADTTVNSLQIRDGVAYVDLSGASLAGLSAAEIDRAATAIHSTLAALPPIEGVALSVDSRPLSTAGEATASPLYFVMGSYLVPLSAVLPTDTTDPRAVMDAYLHGPPDRSTLAGLPADTSLLALDFNPENGLVKVNLRYTEAVRALALADPDRMRLVLNGLIATLTELPGVKAVMLDFEGRSQLGLGQCASLLRTPQLRPQGLNIETATR